MQWNLQWIIQDGDYIRGILIVQADTCSLRRPRRKIYSKFAEDSGLSYEETTGYLSAHEIDDGNDDANEDVVCTFDACNSDGTSCFTTSPVESDITTGLYSINVSAGDVVGSRHNASVNCILPHDDGANASSKVSTIETLFN